MAVWLAFRDYEAEKEKQVVCEGSPKRSEKTRGEGGQD